MSQEDKNPDQQKDNNITISNEQKQPEGKKPDSEIHDLIVPEHDTPKTSRVPILPLTDTVVFPYTLCTLVIDNEKSINFVTRIAEGERLLALFPDLSNQSSTATPNQELKENKEIKIETIKFDTKTLSRIGVVGRIVKLLKFPDNTVRILVRGLKRVKLLNILTGSPEITGTVEEIPDIQNNSLECAAMAKMPKGSFRKLSTCHQIFRKNSRSQF